VTSKISVDHPTLAALCKMAGPRADQPAASSNGPLALRQLPSIPQAARIQGHQKSEVAGRAQILVVPDLEAGKYAGKRT